MSSLLWVFSSLSLLFALGMVVAARVARSREGELRRTGSQAVGTVVDSRRRAGAQGEDSYAPVVQFTTDTGRRVRAVGDLSSRRPFPTDRPIAVTYNPRDPREVVLGPSRARVYLVAGIVFAVIGIMFSVWGMLA